MYLAVACFPSPIRYFKRTSTRDELFRGMHQFDIPSKLMKLSQMTLGNAWSCVEAASRISNNFKTI
uniref:Uncharacterized protein n=1 Tax=Megaselia scalaris TaxID=36166 RepID=T1GY36_MEGSC